MKNLILALGLAIFTFAACTKTEEPAPYVDPCPTGVMRFVNNSDNPYDVFVDGSKVRQQSGNSTFTHTVSKGSHTVKVQQVSGYILTPTVENYSGDVDGCKEIVISYPQ